MASLQTSFVVIIMMGYLMRPSEAFKYYVGGKEGWSLKPSKTFNHWASLNRFQVNDSLIFKYENGTDSVLQVDQDDYNTCNKTNPILALENKGDHSTFNLDHSGFYFFISGHADNCDKGEKIIILVMAPRNYTLTSPTQAPSPFQGVTDHVLPPAPSTQAPSPVGVGTPIGSQAPSPFQATSSHVLPPAPSPVQGFTHDLPPARSPFRGVTHALPPARSPVQGITPILSPGPSRVGKSTHHHIPSPAPSPIRGVSSHVRPPAPSPTPISSSPAQSPTPVISPAASQAASPGPSDQAPSPNNGKSAAAPTSFGGDHLLMVVLLFWIYGF